MLKSDRHGVQQGRGPFRFIFQFFVFLFFGVMALFVSGCASISVRDIAQERGEIRKPAVICIERFEVERTVVKESFARQDHRGRGERQRHGQMKGQLKWEARELLAAELVSQFSKSIAPARLVPPGTVLPADTWVVSGEITRIQEGSRLLRMGFGLGLGGTKLNTRVAVRCGQGPVFLRFATTGGSGAVPGAATNPAPFSSVPTALLHVKEGVHDDVERTARMIVGSVGQSMVERGWITAERIPKPKLEQPRRLALATPR